MGDLRSQLLTSTEAEDNEVSVNQRALIDKILARYSSDYTVFRELIQNANDAGASEVEVVFTTAPISAPAAPEPASRKEISPAKDKDGFSFASWFLNRASKVAEKVQTTLKEVAQAPKPTREVTGITISNNGQAFSKDDWSRIRKIAEGNPDEGKIGMFGVGFYSVFAVTEMPLISSGDTCMLFYWRGDQLYTKKAPLGADARSDRTTFDLKLRDPDTLPSVPELARFIATSIGFTANLRRIVVRIDDQEVITVSKREGATGSKELNVSSSWTKRSPEGLFSVTGVSLRNVQMETEIVPYRPPPEPAAVQPGALSPAPASDPRPQPQKSSLFFRLATLNLAVALPRQLATEMERTTKKRPPSKTQITLLYANADELGSSLDGPAAGRTNSIFADLIATPSNQGSVIIGFRTQQTTGCSASMAAAFIPTVERESLDFVDRALAIWNKELLSMCGLLARLIFEDDLGSVKMIWQPRPPKIVPGESLADVPMDEADKEALLFAVRRNIHALRSFGFLAPSTPHQTVGRIVGQDFFNSAGSAIPMVTTRGVVTTRQARLIPTSGKPDVPTLLTLCKLTPLVPVELYNGAKAEFEALRRLGIIDDIRFEDVATEVDSRVFSEAEVEALMMWWISMSGSREREKWTERIWGRLKFSPAPGGDGKKAPRQWRNLRFFVNPTRIAPELVESMDTALPFSVSKGFPVAQLTEQFGLVEVPLLHWITAVAANEQFEKDPAYAERILAVVSRVFSTPSAVSAEDRRKIVQLLQEKRCCPTKAGMQKPPDSYLPKVTLFDDLPTLQLSNPRSLSDAFCREIGLRDHVEVGLVLSRVSQLGFNHESLVRYLAATQLTDIERSRLSQTRLFPREGADPSAEGLWRPVDLYFPVDVPGMTVQTHEFGLPLLVWTKNKLRLASDEGKLLQALGVRTAIPLADWLALASDPKCDLDRRKKLIRYLLERRDSIYLDYDGGRIAAQFLPATLPVKDGKTEEVQCSPRECYADPACWILSFPVLDPDFRSSAGKLGVAEKPPVGAALQRLLASPPTDKEWATRLFAYFATRLPEIPVGDFKALATKKFIPVFSPQRKPELMEPGEVYLSAPDEAAYGDLDLAVVDFGLAGNSFLKACGVADKPSPQELARRVLRDPGSFLAKVGPKAYLSLLRQLSVLPIDNQLTKEMRTKAWLLALKNEARDGVGVPLDDETDMGRDASWTLARADSIYLIDDPVLFQTFLPLSSPQETILEQFYERLGSRWISREVSEDWQIVGAIRTTPQAEKLQKLLHQRAPLLLYDVGRAGGPTRDSLTNDLRNLQDMLNGLNVGEVDQISIKRTFQRTVVKVTPTTSSIAQDRYQKRWLLVTANYDFFDVSQAIGKLLFKHPRLQDSLLLSTLLSSSLLNLKRKGFPVDRLLNNEVAQAQKIAVAALPPPPPAVAPAASSNLAAAGGDSADGSGAVVSRTPSPAADDTEVLSNWFEDLGRWFTGNEPKKPAAAGTPAPPPERMPGGFAEAGGAHKPVEHADPRQTARLKNELRAAIESSRPVSESNFRATIPERPQTAAPAIPEDHCRVLLDSDLRRVGTVQGFALFAEKGPGESDVQRLVSSGTADAFAAVIGDLAREVFAFPNLGAVNIWWDARGSTIAFNRNRTIFVNLRFFADLHHKKATIPDTYAYWFTTMCHELAHHFIEAHDARHGYYTECLTQTYLPKLVPVVASKGTGI
ncbi:hypothetical protein DFJ74DRAFT_666285 [Hyaloraphidium curvatum]|nr:hypothetical protein DFJ74DRAFT_666285 [Hyaloraphidium curvatum]